MGTQYDAEFKKEIVAKYLTGKSYSEVSQEYGVAKTTILGWVKKYSEECQYKKPQSTANQDIAKELREKNKRIAELEKENLFLKKAAAFFAKELE